MSAIKKRLFSLFLSLLLPLFFTLAASTVQASDTIIIKAVGTWDYFTNYQKHERPFWNQRIAEVSGNRIVGEIKPHTQLDLRGSEIMRLVKNGVFDFAFGMSGYVVSDSAIFEGADLSSLVQDIKVQRRVSDAYFPTLSRAFADKYNAKLMLLYPFPSQMIWCAEPVASIDDLAGKKVRVYLETLADFVEGVGGVAVNAPYSEVPEALQSGRIDCAITGTMSAYTSGLYKVAPYGFTLRVGWGLAFGAMNMDKWQRFSQQQQALLLQEVASLRESMWQETQTEDAIALACLSQGPCALGEIGNMTLAEPSVTDLARRDSIAERVVLPRWAGRCGPECAANWNRTVGKVLGVKAKGVLP
ncbi:MAG: TRAP transporter substrate-binding protein [Pseudomonadales bacterium]